MNEIQYKLVKFDEKGRSEFKDLHNVLFKNTAVSLEWIDWYWDLALDVRVYGAYSGSSLIGIWCVEPRELRRNGKIEKVGRCFSVGVHPAFQRRGIFVALSKFAIQQEKKIGEYSYILGFPQVGRSVIDGHLKAGWEFIQDIDILSFKPNVVDETSSLTKTKKIYGFKPVSTDGFVVDQTYKWARWLLHPDHHYICLNHGSADIVIKPYADSCHVLDLEGQLEDVGNLLDVSKTLAKRHGWKEINLWCASNNRLKEIVKACGFTTGSDRASSIKLLAVKISSVEPLSFSECNFQMGVEEMY